MPILTIDRDAAMEYAETLNYNYVNKMLDYYLSDGEKLPQHVLDYLLKHYIIIPVNDSYAFTPFGHFVTDLLMDLKYDHV